MQHSISRTYTRAASRRRPELAIAPLVDVVFLLLIFFMVTTTFKQELGILIERAEAATSDALAMKNMIFGVTDDDRYVYGDVLLTLDQVAAEVEVRLARDPDVAIIIVADRDSRTQAVVDILDECRQAGARDLSLATRRESAALPSP